MTTEMDFKTWFVIGMHFWVLGAYCVLWYFDNKRRT